MAGKSSKPSRFQQVELGQIEGRRCVIEAVPEAMSAFGWCPNDRCGGEERGVG